MTRKHLSKAMAYLLSLLMIVSLVVPIGAQAEVLGADFIPVTGVTGVPTNAVAGQVINLNRAPMGPIAVQPANATSAQGLLDFHFVSGTGGVTAWYMQGDLTLEGAGPGTVTINARVVDGLGPGVNFYSPNFTINVAGSAEFVPVTGITALPATAMVNHPLTLTGDAQPANATNRAITWSIYNAGPTGAVISGNVFTASAEGVATIQATITNGTAAGTPFVVNFNVDVVEGGDFIPVADITGVPSQLADPTPFAAGVGLRPTTLRGVVEPYDATNQTVVWSVVDAGATGATITDNVITVNAVGNVTVRATIADGLDVGNFTKDFTLEVVTPRFTMTHLSANGDDGSAVHMNEGWIRIDNDGGSQLGIGFRPLDERMELIIDDGWAFKDMAGDGVLHPYVDWRLDYRERAENLVELLTMHEITGLMMHSGHTGAALNPSEANLNLIRQGLRAILVTTFPGGGIGGVGNATQWTNRMQRYAEDHCRLSIPINFSTDPRDYGGGAMDMSMFPTNMGLGATFDPFLAYEIQRRKSAEFRAVGITTYLGPMIDLASEPRWYRFTQTFSEDPLLLTDMVDATVSAFQSSFEYDPLGNPVDIGWGLQSVSTMMKHFSGDGASEGGRGSHSQHGHFNVFPGSIERYDSPYPGFRMHYMAFTDGGMFPQGLAGPARAMMTNYSVAWDPAGEGSMYISATGTPDPRGSDFGVFGPHVATAISSYKNNLARRYGFEGPITTDWGAHVARRWGTNLHGVDSTSVGYQVMRVIMAGSDQIGGMNNRAQMNEAFGYAADIYGYEVAVARWEASGRRFSENFFLLGLFDNPYRNLAETLDPVYGVAGTSNAAIAREARLRGVVMLSNNITTDVGGVEVHTPVVTEDWFETQWPNFAVGPADRPTVYVPFEQRTAAWAFPGPNAAGRADLRAELDLHFNVITDDVVGGVIIRPDAATMATVDFAIVFSRNPVNQPGGTLWNQGWNAATNSYHPVTLQFSPYVADGDYVRRESIAGHPVLAERYAGSPTGFRTIAGAPGRPTHGTAPVGHVTPPVILSNPATPIPGTDGIYWARENRSYYGREALIQNPDQLDAFRFARDNVNGPVIMGIDIWNPIVFAELYDYVDAIFISFQSQDYRSMLPLMLGQVEPSALLPVQMPLDMDAVERQHEDVPRDMDVFVCSRGNGFDFAFGLNWDGRIQDARTARYDIPVQWTPQHSPDEFIPATGIEVPESIYIGRLTSLEDVTNVLPANATHRNIIWEILEADGTGVSITDGLITATAPGTIRLRASILNGAEWNRIFVQEFEVEAIKRVQPSTFDLVVDVLEWGSAVTAVVIDMGEVIDQVELADIADEIDVSAVVRHPGTNAVFFDGERIIENIWLSATSDIEHTLVRRDTVRVSTYNGAATGQYIVLELRYGFNNTAGQVNGSEASRWLGGGRLPAGNRNHWLGQDYTLSIVTIPFTFENVIRPIYDDFELVNGVGAFSGQRYRMFTPDGATEPLPLVLWSHGAGETLGGNAHVNNAGSQLFANMGGIGWILNAPEDAIILAPQRNAPGAYASMGWAPYSRAGVVAFINHLIAEGIADPNRIYVSGPSAGSSESQLFMLENPGLITAALLICTAGGGAALSEANAETIAHIPMWHMQAREFTGSGQHNHGNAVINNYERLSALGGAEMRLTVYNRVFGTELPNEWYLGNVHPQPEFMPQDGRFYPDNHWSWVIALNNVEVRDHNDDGAGLFRYSENAIGDRFMDWLFAQRKDTNMLLDQSGTHTFPPAVVGYGPQEALTVTVSSTGQAPTGALTITLSGPNANAFTVSPATIADIAGQDIATFTVVPNVGLSVGTYTATVTVDGEGVTARSFNVSFTVTATPTYPDLCEECEEDPCECEEVCEECDEYPCECDDAPARRWYPSLSQNRFDDVQNHPHWQNNPISWADRNGITQGIANTNPPEFRPNGNLTREMFATFLHRIADLPEAEEDSNFDDSDRISDWAVDAVNWAAEIGVIEGFPDGTFRPYANITREQIAVVLFRYAEFIEANTRYRSVAFNAFPDRGQVSDWATDAMRWATHHGIIIGIRGNMAPHTNATRAETVTMLQRFVERFDVPPPSWVNYTG